MLFPESNLCQGSYIKCAFTWHYASEYRNESVLVDFACFQNDPPISYAFTWHYSEYRNECDLAEQMCMLFDFGSEYCNEYISE